MRIFGKKMNDSAYKEMPHSGEEVVCHIILPI